MQILILYSVYGLTGLLECGYYVTHFEHGDNPTANHTYEYLSCDQRSSKFGLIWEGKAFEEDGRIFEITFCEK
jgi:hypothetical protein